MQVDTDWRHILSLGFKTGVFADKSALDGGFCVSDVCTEEELVKWAKSSAQTLSGPLQAYALALSGKASTGQVCS